MSIRRTGVHGHSGHGMVSPTYGGVNVNFGVPLWYDPNNVGLPVIAAYRAIATPGSPWPLAPTNYAETLQDWSGNSPNLIEGNGAVPWNVLTGWGFIAAQSKYFNTGLIPTNDQAWSMLIQYVNANVIINRMLASSRSSAGNVFQIKPSDLGGANVVYSNGGQRLTAGVLNTGNLGVLGSFGYRNGILDSVAIPAWGGASNQPIFIGCQNNAGVPANYITAEIRALVLYNLLPATIQVQALDIATAMSQL